VENYVGVSNNSMLKNENIICISWLVWDSIPLVMHHMMTRLAKNNRILFVDPPIAYSNLAIRPSFLKNHWIKTSQWLKGVQQISESLYVYYPPPLLLHYGHLEGVDKFNQAYTAYAVAKTAAKLGFNAPILWLYHPYAINPNGQFNEKLVCYDCNDDVAFFYTQRFGYKRKRLSMMEEKLTKKADVIFTTSKNLFDLRHSQNPHTYYLPSGIDFDTFHKALSPSLGIPPDINDVPKPIMGFIGGMSNSKMNWEWIQNASHQKPNWSFVFIGPCVEKPPNYITRQENIFFLGTRELESLPKYVKAFDVCLIPYQGENFLKHCFPTKVFEYLAAGKPVVSSYIPALEEFKDVVRLSRNIKEFISNIEIGIREGKGEWFIRRCVQTSKGKTWENRVKKTSEIIEIILRGKNMGSS